MNVRVLLLGVAFAMLSAAPAVAAGVKAPLPDPHQPRVVSMDVGCAYTPLAAKALGVPLCPNPPEAIQEADTLPGTAGNPSPQVITVQGCTGCVSTGSGSGSGASYNAAYSQTNIASSYSGIAAYNYASGNTDALTSAVFGGNGSGTGYPMAYGQPGALVVQGGLQGGAIGISGTLLGTYTSAATQAMTSATPGFGGIGGSQYSGANVTTSATDNYQPAHVSVFGNQYTVPGSEQYTPAAWTTNAQTLVIQNTGGFAIMAIDIPAISTGSGTIAVTEDDGGGNYQWQPICTRNDSFQATAGSLPLSTTNAYSWACNVSPHAWIKLTYTETGSPASFTTPYVLGNGPVSNGIRGTTPVVRGTAGSANILSCSQQAAGSITTTATQLIAGSAGKTTYICSVTVSGYGTNPYVTLTEGTGTNCATGTVTIGSAYLGTATQFPPTTAAGYAVAPVYQEAFCVGGGGTITGGFISVLYDQF